MFYTKQFMSLLVIRIIQKRRKSFSVTHKASTIEKLRYQYYETGKRSDAASIKPHKKINLYLSISLQSVKMLSDISLCTKIIFESSVCTIHHLCHTLCTNLRSDFEDDSRLALNI